MVDPKTMGDPWRCRCPEGHLQWRPAGDEYYCITCGSYFDDLVDWQAEQRDSDRRSFRYTQELGA